MGRRKPKTFLYDPAGKQVEVLVEHVTDLVRSHGYARENRGPAPPAPTPPAPQFAPPAPTPPRPETTEEKRARWEKERLQQRAHVIQKAYEAGIKFDPQWPTSRILEKIHAGENQ